MTIECYHGDCKFHGTKTGVDEGPFCFEPECRASKKEIKRFEIKRKEYLNSIYKKTETDK